MVAPVGRLALPQAWRAVRLAFEKTSRALRDRITQTSRASQALQSEAIYVRVAQPIHRLAAIRQSQSRWLSTQRALASGIRRFTTVQPGRVGRSSTHPSSRTAAAVKQLTTRAPFASTLRPNLTGGALPRTAGGYSTGAGRFGGARHFSHSPAAPAQVVSNVSAAMRAFWLSGQRIQYDGSDRKTGAMRFKTVKSVQHDTGRKLQSVQANTPGSYIDFKTSPIVTAIGSYTQQTTLNQAGLIEALSEDFARALKDLAIITNDLKKLSSVGDLIVTHPESNLIRVRFPGVDGDSIERLCDELGIQRGIVHEDPDFDAYHGTEMALLFPFAPSGTSSEVTSSTHSAMLGKKREDVVWEEMLSPEQTASPGFSHKSATSQDFEQVDVNPWLSSPSGYSSLHESDEDAAEMFDMGNEYAPTAQSNFEGIQGIYRFLEECDRAKRL